MNKRRMAFAVAAPLLPLLVVGGNPAEAATKNTGQDCSQEYFFDGQGLQRVGSRCAKGEITYTSASSVLWTLSTYRMYYSVTAGMSYGPKNNENPYEITNGFKGGTKSYLSPDSGNTNAWTNRNPPNASTYKGQTVVKIDAYPDIPGAGDPRLDCDTATW